MTTTAKLAAIAFAGALTLSAPALAATTIYTNAGTFSAALGTSFTDTYSDPGYSFIQSDAAMTAVVGETRYETTGFTDWNIVSTGYYCAGCNGSFTLYFDNTSYGTTDGVFGVSVDVQFNASDLYDAFVTFGDGSTQNYVGVSAGFYGITSDLLITSIAFGPNGGSSSTSGSFAIDNLTIGSAGAVPEPASWAMMIGGLAVVGATMRRRAAVTNVQFA